MLGGDAISRGSELVSHFVAASRVHASTCLLTRAPRFLARAPLSTLVVTVPATADINRIVVVCVSLLSLLGVRHENTQSLLVVVVPLLHTAEFKKVEGHRPEILLLTSWV